MTSTECENVYEKWLRRRLNYSCIRETGKMCPPQLCHQLLHEGDFKEDVARLLKHRLWTFARYPDPKYFNHQPARYRYPQKIKENLDLRFFDSAKIPHPPSQCTRLVDTKKPYNAGVEAKETTKDEGDDPATWTDAFVPPSEVYRLSLPEVAEVLSQSNPTSSFLLCPHSHQHEKPPTWDVGCHSAKKPPNSVCASHATFPVCSYKDSVCCQVHCSRPNPVAVFSPGPWMPREFKVEWQ